MVFASKICCSTQVLTSLVTEHRYCNMNLVVSVLPAPLSPDMTHDWFESRVCKLVYAASASAKTCGSRVPILVPWYWNTWSWNKCGTLVTR